MRRIPAFLAAASCAGLLAACGASESSSCMIDGADNSLTLVRDKPYAWSGSWELAMVVTHLPDCQRRHRLKNGSDGNFRLEVYRPAEGAYILHYGKRWYVAELRSCRLQAYEEPPGEPGELVGNFETRGDPLHFVAATTPGAEGSAEKSTTPEPAPR
jgi:hypothetical protein